MNTVGFGEHFQNCVQGEIPFWSFIDFFLHTILNIIEMKTVLLNWQNKEVDYRKYRNIYIWKRKTKSVNDPVIQLILSIWNSI